MATRNLVMERYNKTMNKSGAATKTTAPQLQGQINNYKNRLQALGINPEEATDTRNWLEKKLNLKEDQNVLFDIFELINRPQQALFGGVNNLIQGEDFGEGFKEGLTGEKETSGGEILRNLGMEGSGEFNLFDPSSYGEFSASDALGFGLDLFADPLDYARLPVKVLDKASDTAKTVWKPANQALFSYAGQGIKKGLGLGDTAISKTLSKLDAKEMNNLQKAADKVGLSVDDFVKLNGLKLEDFGNKAASYAASKQSLKDIFAEGKTKLGKLKKGVQETEGANKQFAEIFKKYDDNLQDLSYNYVMKNMDLSKYGDDVTKLNDFISKKGNTISKWVSENRGTELAKALKSEQDDVAENILNVIQSTKDTSVSGNKVLRELENGYSFRGSEESVNDLVNALNRINAETGAGIQFNKINKYDNVSRDMADVVSQIESGELTGDALKAAQDRLAKLQDINPDTLERILKIDNLGTLQKNDPTIQKIFDDLNLNRSWEYTNSELNKLNELKNNPEFMNLVGQHQDTYKNVADMMQKVTGMDYSDIVNRSSYVRKAKGNIGDLDEDIKKVNELIEATTDVGVKQDLEAYRDALQKESASTVGGSADKFGSQKYSQPALVANRQYQESIEKAQRSIESKLTNLKEQFSDVASSKLKEEISNLKAIKDGTASATKLERWNKRITKTGEKLDSLNEQINTINNSISNIQNKIDSNIIDKSLKIQDKSLSPRLAKELTDEQSLVKQYDKLTKQLDKIDDLSSSEAKALAKQQRKVGQDLIEASNKARATMAMIDGHIDDTIGKELESNAKNIKKLINDNSRLADKLGKKGEAAATLQETSKAIKDFTSNIDQQIAKKASALRSIDPTKDALIESQIKHYETVKSILETKAGKELFDLNYYAGLENFVQNAEYTNKTARLFRDALTTGALSDSNMIKSVTDAGGIPKGWQKVNGNKLAEKLNDVQNIMGDSVSSDLIKDTISSLKGNTYYMNPRAAQLFNVATASRGETNAFLNMLDKANTSFKKLSTLTPGFQMRNYIGNSTNMYLAGMPVKDIVPYQAKATKVLNQAEDLMSKFSKGIEFTADEAKAWDLLSDFYKGGFAGAGSAVRDLEKVQESIKVGKGVKPVNKIAEINMNLNESADAMNRMAMLMYAKDKPQFLQKLGVDSPVKAVKYALMDPSDMSDFERNVIKKVIPFYTFTKQNLMFQASNIAKNTGRYTKLVKTLNKMYEGVGEDNYYKYQKESMQIPIPGAKDADGNQLFLKANLPLSDLGEFLSSPLGRTTASLTPVIKAPVELKTGKSLFTGEDSSYNVLSNTLNKLGVRNQGIYDAAQAAETILNNFGLQNVSTNLVRKLTTILDRDNSNVSDKQLWAEIFRSVLQNTNREDVVRSGLYDEMEAYQSIIKRLKKQGVDVPTMTQINKMKLNKMKNKRASLK